MAELLFFISAFIAEVIGTIVGFGSSTIFLPLALFFVDFKTALTLVAFFHIFGNLGRITFFRHGLDKKLILIFGIPSVILTVIGALLVNYTPHDVLKLVLGVFLLVFSITSIVKPWFKFKPSNKNAIIGGGLSGFLAGLIGTGGALRGAFLSAFNSKKTVYIATAEMPGLEKQDIKINLTEDRLEISAETKHEEKKEEKGYVYRERRAAGYYRAISLPSPVDTDITSIPRAYHACSRSHLLRTQRLSQRHEPLHRACLLLISPSI